VTADEVFEIFDATGALLGRAPRAEVHRLGYWHKAVNVLLFDSAGRLYLQRRAIGKDVWPDAWDVSVGEHLLPGESAIAGAVRGLAEELGIHGAPLTPVGSLTAARIEIPTLDIRDNELQQSFSGVYDGALAPNPDEVAAVRKIERAALIDEIRRNPDAFTPWLRERLLHIGWT